MEKLIFSKKEVEFFRRLSDQKIRFMVVGVGAAVLQGASLGTQDVDLWFETLDDPRIAETIRKLGGFYIPAMIWMQTPPRLGGPDFQLLDIAVSPYALEAFSKEYRRAKTIIVQGIKLKVLPLGRVLHSKKKLGRPKDLMAIPALENALAALKKRGRK